MSRGILHVTQPSEAGVAGVVLHYATHHRAAGFPVTVACQPDSPLWMKLIALGVETRAWPASRGPGLRVPAEARRLARVIEDVAPAIVHLHSAKAGLAGRLALRGRRPTVFQPHAWSFEAVRGPLRAASLRWERAAARWTGVLLCVSEAERARGERAGVRGRYEVAPNGVDLTRFTPGSRAAARDMLGLGPEPLAVCVGRLCRQKGQDILLAAWPAVRRQVPAARLALVGAGPDGDALRSRAPDDVTFTGQVDDPRPWYAAADVVVLPSRWEGMALVPLEAQACGRAVVATDVTGVRESLPPGTAGLVAPGDVPGLAAAVAARLADPGLAAAEARRGQTHVAGAHDASRVADMVSRIYRQLLQPA